MTYAELSEAQARRSRQFAEAQTDAMSVYCDAERDLKELQAENAKLRGLIADVHEALCLDKTTLFREAIIKSLGDDMRKLGIEVES